MTTIDQLREGLTLLVDGAITHDVHPADILMELQDQIRKMLEMIAEAEESAAAWEAGQSKVDELSRSRPRYGPKGSDLSRKAS